MSYTPFDAIQIGIASPEMILRWSYGDVKKPENKPRNIFYNPSFNDFWNGVGETI